MPRASTKGPGQPARFRKRKQEPRQLTNGNIEATVKQEKDPGQTYNGRRDGKPPGNCEEHSDRCQGGNGDRRGKLATARKDQQLRKAQNAYSDNDSIGNAKEWPAPQTAAKGPGQQDHGSDCVLDGERAQWRLRWSGCSQQPSGTPQ